MADPLLDEFLTTKKKTTRHTYKNSLHHYTTYTGKTLTELVEEAEEEQQNNILKRKRRIKKYLEGYKRYREGLGHSTHTVRNSLTLVRSFYTFFDVDVPHKRMTYTQVDRVGADTLPSRDDIRRVLQLASLKYRAIILIGCSSGMGASEICSLTVENFLNGIDVKEPVSIGELRTFTETERAPLIKWNIHRVKTGTPYLTFSNPETLHMILDYLEVYNPHLTPGPLFTGENGGRLQPKSLTVQFQRLNTRMGWGRVGRQGYFRSHVLRKWFASHIERKIGYSATRRLLGHRVAVDPVGDSYILTDPEHLGFLYRQGMDSVSILDKVRVHDVKPERIMELERRVRELEELKRAWELYDQLP